jgi:DNA-binding response OmpR family regulator
MARILVVDDEADIRFVLESLLVERGHSVATAADGAAALATLAEERFDVMVLDVMMPGTSGIEVLDRVRADRRLRGLPVIVLSADSNVISRARGLRHGADDYVGKPFDMDELMLRIERLVERARGDASLAGDLQFLGTGGVLEVLAQTNSTARISIPLGEARGEIAIARGRLAAASFGALTGPDAVLALLDVAHGRFSISEEQRDLPLPAEAPLVHSLLLERAWLDDEVHKRSESLPTDDRALEPTEGGTPAGREAAEVPWARVLDVIRARPGVTAGELPELLPLAPVRLRLALALLVESGSVRVRPPHDTDGGEGRLAGVLSDLLLEALFNGHDVDRLKIEILADATGFARAAGWLARIPDALRDRTVDSVDFQAGRLTAHLHHPTGHAEVALRRLGWHGKPPALAADAQFCVLLVLETDAHARQREAQLLVDLLRSRQSATAMVWISSAAREQPALLPWRRAAAVPANLEELFDRLLEARATA